MGQPKKQKNKYSTPRHPWQRARIEEERPILKEYGLKRKNEIWKMSSVIRNFKDQVKRLQALTSKQAELEKNQLFKKLSKLGLISENATFDDVLGLGMKSVMERRLQTLIVRKGLAKTMDQARQFIVHGHVQVGGEKITSPSYLVPVISENTIGFLEKSSFIDEMHPERVKKEPVKTEIKKEEAKERKTEGKKHEKAKLSNKEEKKAEEKPAKKNKEKEEKKKEEVKKE
jgi:small subunit ribosomal protein S4